MLKDCDMDIEHNATNTPNSPKRKVLGDIKNVSGDSPGNPVSPTANLKLLTRVASQFIKRDFGDCLFNDKSPVKIEDHSSENTCKEFSEIPNKNTRGQTETPKGRKDKSLSILCDKFLELFPLDVKPGSNICISLDHAAAQLGTERRRLYDIINVLESLQIASKIGKNCYQWFGKQQLCKTLVELKILATKLGYENKIQAIQNWRCCSSGSSTFTESPSSQSADTTRDERSLGILCQKFLMLFLASKKTDLVNLDMAAHVVISASEMEHSRSNFKEGDSCKMCQHKAKARRLYDIANVLVSLGLIRKVRSLDCLMRKPAFQYCGPDIETEELNSTNEVSLPVHATRHSLLRPTNFEMDCQGRKRSASGSRSFEKFKRTQSDSVLVPSQFGLSAVEDGFLASDNWKNVSNESLSRDIACDSVKDNSEVNECKELKAQAYDQITLIPIGMEVDWKKSVEQSKETLRQLHVMPSILSDINSNYDMRKQSDKPKSSTNFVRHNSEPCVSKSSILVKRKLVKVTPLNKASDCTLMPISKSPLTQFTEVDNTLTKSAASHSEAPLRMIDVNAKKPCIIVTQGQLEVQVKKGKTFSFSKEELDTTSLSSNSQKSGQKCDLACYVPNSCPPLLHTPISIQNELHSSSRLQVTREYINTASEMINFPLNSLITKPAISKISNNYSCESDKSSHMPTVLIPLKQSGVLQNALKSAKKVNEINNGVIILSNKYSEANKNSFPSDNCISSSELKKHKIGCIMPQNCEIISLTHRNESDVQCLQPHSISPIPGSVPNVLSDNTRSSCSVEGVLLPTVVPGELYTAVKVGSVLQLVPVSSAATQNLS